MSDLAVETRRRHLERVRRLTPAGRVELALRLGDEDVAALAAALGVGLREARRILRARRQLGRTPCSLFGGSP